MRVIEIVPYSARWAEEFRAIGAGLRVALGDLALRIDHIGSTSVPGLAAKDVIDVQVTVENLQAPELASAFASAGYHLREAWEYGDHRPPGADGPASDWAKRFATAPDGERHTNVHVREAGRANQRYALLFRDFLRTHSETAAAYAALKRELAKRHPHDIEAYVEIKDPVCDVIVAAAEEWAATADWHPGPVGA